MQIPIYTSVPTGVLPANGYIEFWGKKNDGKPDRALYKNPNNQLSDALSLETDTVAYFLTVNSPGNNFVLSMQRIMLQEIPSASALFHV